jgi:hypothetical protein
MSAIAASVGRGGINRQDDVRIVQNLLNKNRSFGQSPITVNGLANAETIAAIEDFQRRALKLTNPDGRVDPNGNTLKALDGGGLQNTTATNLSGAAWWHANQAKFPNSSRVEDLEATFRNALQEFLAALQSAGATVSISATRRNKQRAHLMHHSFKIAKDTESLVGVPSEPGVNIVWDHGDFAKSKAAAQEMVDLFVIVFEPSLTSLHITGQAVDMDISWSGTLAIRAKAGQIFRIDTPRDGSNTVLHTVGTSYGVRKLLSDPPHWSATGH